MTPTEIRNLIAATPAAMAMLDTVRNDTPPVPDTTAIAVAISAGRTKTVDRNIGDGEIALALGIPAGPLFLMQLEDAASARPAAGASTEQVAIYATARTAWRALEKHQLEIGNPAVREAIDLYVGTLLTAEQAASIKALAEQPDAVSEWDVRRAVLADDGSLLV